MRNIFDYANSYKAATQVCNKEAFETMLDSEKVRQLCEETAGIMARWTPDMTTEEYHQLKNEAAVPKKQLPVLMPHAHFTDAHRHKQSAEESQLMSMDFDSIDNPEELWHEVFESRVEELRIYLAFISPSRKGIKIVSQLPDGMDREAGQRWFAKQVGIEDYDHTHDLARCVYMVPRENLMHYEPEKLFATSLKGFRATKGRGTGLQPEGTTDGSNPGTSYPVLSPLTTKASPTRGCRATDREQSSLVLASSQMSGSGSDASSSQMSGTGSGAGSGQTKTRKTSYRYIKHDKSLMFRGVLYTEIVKAVLQSKFGYDEPPVGERHRAIMELALSLMYICDFDKDVMMAVLPRFGKPDSEVADIVKDTLSWRSKHYSPYTPKTVQEIISNINEGKTESEALAMTNPFASRPKLPKRLPAVLKGICSKVVMEYRPAVLNQAMTAFMSHLHGVQFKYINNTSHEPASMSVVVGPPSIGKGAIVKPIDFITADMRKRDDENRARQDEWRDSQKGKSDDEKVVEPKDIYITMPMLDLTSPALSDRLDRLNRNGQRVLYWKMNEIEMLNQVSTKEIPTDKIICLAYDRDEYGQERVSADAVNVRAPLRLNFTASTTEENVRQFLKKSLLNGTLSRLSFSMVHFMNESDEDDIPMFGDYDDAYMDAIRPCVERLNEACGEIESRKVQTLTRELLEWCVSEKYCYEEGPAREVYKELYKRAIRIAFDKAMTLYIMNGYRWDEACSEYIRYSVADDLWCKIYLFSDMMLEQKRGNKDSRGVCLVKVSRNIYEDLYKSLPDNFSIDIFEQQKSSYGIKRETKKVINSLKTNYGLIKISKNHWIKRHEENKGNEE